MKKIILAGGCFWGVEAYFSRVMGVKSTTVGYIDGSKPLPTYEDVSNGSGHAEAVYLEYDETIINLTQILKHFFRIIDPTEINKQGNDFGIQYRTAIYCFDKTDLEEVKHFIDSIRKNYKKTVQTKVFMKKPFYKAEEYHQKYLDKFPNGYCHIDLNLLKEKLK